MNTKKGIVIFLLISVIIYFCYKVQQFYDVESNNLVNPIETIDNAGVGDVDNTDLNSTTNTVEVIDNDELLEKFISGAQKIHQSGGYTSLEDLSYQLSSAFEPVEVNLVSKNSSSCRYSETMKSVLLIGLIYENENGGQVFSNIASAFVLNNNGVCATNHHVFRVMAEPVKGSMLMAVMDCQGNVFPIEKILCAREADDLAIFKINSGDVELTPMELSNKPAQVGERISLISHPMQRFYHFSEGCVTRYYYDAKFKTKRMSTSVNFAQGSSGAPFFNKKGEVVGVVSSTVPLIAGGQYKSLQMTVYETIPVSALMRMIK